MTGPSPRRSRHRRHCDGPGGVEPGQPGFAVGNGEPSTGSPSPSSRSRRGCPSPSPSRRYARAVSGMSCTLIVASPLPYQWGSTWRFRDTAAGCSLSGVHTRIALWPMGRPGPPASQNSCWTSKVERAGRFPGGHRCTRTNISSSETRVHQSAMTACSAELNSSGHSPRSGTGWSVEASLPTCSSSVVPRWRSLTTLTG